MAEAQVGVGYDQFSPVVTHAASEVNKIGKLDTVSFHDTTLSRFTALGTTVDSINTALHDFIAASDVDTSKMLKTAEDISAQDKSFAGQISNNKVRFQ